MSIRDKKFVFTGKISIPREEAWNKVLEAGGEVSHSVTKDCSYAVVGSYKGEEPGSKFFKAQQLGIKIITEEEFLKMLETPVVEDSEEPLPVAQLQSIIEQQERVPCNYCSSPFTRWKSQTKLDTCFICELKDPPACTNCLDTTPLYVTDIGEYHCGMCGNWFKGPKSIRAKTVKHHCKPIFYTWPSGNSLWICQSCAKPFIRTEEDIQEAERRLKEGPKLVIRLAEQKKELEKIWKENSEQFLEENKEDIDVFKNIYEEERKEAVDG